MTGRLINQQEYDHVRMREGQKVRRNKNLASGPHSNAIRIRGRMRIPIFSGKEVLFGLFPGKT